MTMERGSPEWNEMIRVKQKKECDLSVARGLFELHDIRPRIKPAEEHYEYARKVGYKIPRCYLDKDEWENGSICRFCHFHPCVKPI